MDADKARDTPRRGRPKASDPGASLSTWLRGSEYDKLVQLAKKHDTSVSALARQIIVRRLPQ